MPMPVCQLCGSRRAKRACPALGRQICAVCCGTKRLTEIACPPSCPYLTSSREHPPAVAQKRQERDLRFMLPLLTELSEAQYRLLLVFQGLTLRHAASSLPPLLDQEVAEAAGAVAATLETAGKGIIYQHQAASMTAQRLASAFETALGELRTGAGAHVALAERDAAVALRQLARAARDASGALPGDDPPVFLKLLERIMTRPAPGGPGAGRPDDETRPPLIIPG